MWEVFDVSTQAGSLLQAVGSRALVLIEAGVLYSVIWCKQNTLSERRRSLTELLVQLLKERDQREAELRHRLVSTHFTTVKKIFSTILSAVFLITYF